MTTNDMHTNSFCTATENLSTIELFDAFIKSDHIDNDQTDSKEDEKFTTLNIFLKMCGDPLGKDEDVADKAMGMFDGKLEFKNKRLSAICFFRLLPCRSIRWMAELPWRPKIVNLIESQLSDEIYFGKYKAIESLQTHEKIEKYVEILHLVELNFNHALNMLTSLEQFHAQRENLIRVIKGNLGKNLIAPFLLNGIESQLIELYKRIEFYLEKRDSLQVVDAYNAANEEIERFLVNTMKFNTFYGNLLAAGVGKRLSFLIENDFSDNKATQPAKLTLEARDKKYPFHHIGNFVDLGFVVKNDGQGYSYNTVLTLCSDTNLYFVNDEIEIGRLAPGEAYPIEIASEIKIISNKVNVIFELKWKNFDGESITTEFEFILKSQKSDIDWQMFSRSDPYSLEPVAVETDLVGRRDVLNRLIGTQTATIVGSSIISGQKRVGKTSIAKALYSHLESAKYISVYLESGDYVEPDARATVIRLGRLLCKAINGADHRIKHLPIPNFQEALAPLAEYLQEILTVIEDRPIVFILDEFDELPLELYSRGPIGNAFFLTLRSISSRSKIGFVLVGGEKMAHIMDCQGEKLNKWRAHSVDYFTREDDWCDYKELIQRPVGENLEFTENALIAIHNETAGNPYFTKLVCQFIVRIAIDKRDCHITTSEVKKAIELTARETQQNIFQHFWDDGIFGKGETSTSKSIRRRKILIAISDLLFNKKNPTLKNIQDNKLLKNISGLTSELQEFVSRKVLILNNEIYGFKVKLFQKWLERRGICDVIATFSDINYELSEREKEESLKIKPEEIVGIISKWKTYKGQSISEDRVRAWLNQFCGTHDQRSIFQILKGLKFYSNEFVRQKMVEVDGIVRRGTVRQIERRKLKRSDILVSYLDSPAKSGAHFARLYADEASIYVENVIEKGSLLQALNRSEDIQALVFIDDFIGTGETASSYLKSLDQLIADIIIERKILVVFVGVIAFVDGINKIEKTIDSLKMSVRLHVCEQLNNTAKCFSDSSEIYPDPDERIFAKSIALRLGKNLEKKCPLGYGDLEMAVVFERSCPNNTLPILWSESSNPKWYPLFKRL